MVKCWTPELQSRVEVTRLRLHVPISFDGTSANPQDGWRQLKRAERVALENGSC
jgi:hypothetical protein